MTLFVDTSALYALLDADDQNHRKAAAAFSGLRGRPLVTHNYVLVEASALVQRRLGAAALRLLLDSLVAPLRVLWVDERVHAAATSAVLAAADRGVSLVDWVSFEVMRREGIESAFAFDRDFAAQGFATVP